jgi:hypothetical protein
MWRKILTVKLMNVEEHTGCYNDECGRRLAVTMMNEQGQFTIS